MALEGEQKEIKEKTESGDRIEKTEFFSDKAPLNESLGKQKEVIEEMNHTSKTIELILAKVAEKTAPNFKDYYNDIANEQGYIVRFAMYSMRIISASKQFRSKMKWPLQRIIDASEKVDGVKKFSEMVAGLIKKGEQNIKLEEVYTINAEDGRKIHFKPYVTIFSTGPFAAKVELGEFDKLNNFFYKLIKGIPTNQKVILPQIVDVSQIYDIERKLRAAYVNNKEVFIDTRGVNEIKQEGFGILESYARRRDCEYKLIISEKREKQDAKYAEMLDSLVNIGYHWEKMGVVDKKSAEQKGISDAGANSVSPAYGANA